MFENVCMNYMSSFLLLCRFISYYIILFLLDHIMMPLSLSFLSYSAARHSVLCIPRKPGGISWCDFDAKEEFVRPYYDVRLYNQHKFSRHTVVRSGLIETGTSDAALPGFSNEPFLLLLFLVAALYI